MDNNLEAHDVGFVIPDIVEIMLNKTWKNTPTNLTWGEEEKTLRDGLLNSLKNANLEEVAGVDIQLVDCLEEQELQIWVDECPDLQGLDLLKCLPLILVEKRFLIGTFYAGNVAYWME